MCDVSACGMDMAAINSAGLSGNDLNIAADFESSLNMQQSLSSQDVSAQNVAAIDNSAQANPVGEIQTIDAANQAQDIQSNDQARLDSESLGSQVTQAMQAISSYLANMVNSTQDISNETAIKMNA